MSNVKRTGKIRTMQDVEDEIARLEGHAELQKIAIKQKLHPAKVVKDILQKKKVIPRPANPELAMEGFDFAINFLVDRVILRNANPTVRTLSVYVLREIARNYAYGRDGRPLTHLKEVLNMKKRDGQREPGYKRLDDPVDEYYENL